MFKRNRTGNACNRFLTNREFKKLQKNLCDPSGVILCKKMQLSTDIYKTSRNNNVIIFGGTKEERIRCFIEPNILQGNENFIVCDAEGILHKKYRNFLESSGYAVKTIDCSKYQNADDAGNLLKSEELDFKNFPMKKQYLFILTQKEKSAVENSFLSCLYLEMLSMASGFRDIYAKREGQRDNEEPPYYHVRYVINEPEKTGGFPDMADIMESTGQRLMGVRYLLAFDSVEDFRRLFGKERKAYGLCDSKIFLSPNDRETAEFMKKRLGILNIKNGKVEWLMDEHDLFLMPKDSCIVSIRGSYPYIGKKFFPQDHPGYPTASQM